MPQKIQNFRTGSLITVLHEGPTSQLLTSRCTMPMSAIFVLSQNIEYEQPRREKEDNGYQVFGKMKIKGGKNVRIALAYKKSIFRNSK